MSRFPFNPSLSGLLREDAAARVAHARYSGRSLTQIRRTLDEQYSQLTPGEREEALFQGQAAFEAGRRLQRTAASSRFREDLLPAGSAATRGFRVVALVRYFDPQTRRDLAVPIVLEIEARATRREIEDRIAQAAVLGPSQDTISVGPDNILADYITRIDFISLGRI